MTIEVRRGFPSGTARWHRAIPIAEALQRYFAVPAAQWSPPTVVPALLLVLGMSCAMLCAPRYAGDSVEKGTW